MRPTRFLAVLLLTACARLDPGEPCEATGDGFQRHDPCAETCVEWVITCPSGAETVPGVCSGGECDTDTDCDAGFTCLTVGSVTRECLPAEVCGG